MKGAVYPFDVDGKSARAYPSLAIRESRPMSTDTLTRADLTEAVFQAVGLSRNESAQMVEDLLEEVCAALSRGETVKLSSFGTFAVRQKSQRMGRNPKTGDEVPIAPRRVLVFRPSHVLKAIINGQTPDPDKKD
ncbi:MAG TPA: integration host factor subunit alpha [Rhizomicrobium sp.]|nr:integration host factor subunit alpha [Rhizomicrobium sp.]